ncbi:MAG: ABC transporter ATP-binding protein [Acidobacteriia bacterium]|nr:ABC transporter ATP-binding protein [Terriglobia bacterium]
MRPNASSPALEACEVSFAYRNPVVRNLTIELMPGTVTGIIGPNGSGKTTVLRLLGGILRPASGSILLNGEMPLAELPRKQVARRIAMVPQSAGDGSQLTVLQFALQGRSPHMSLFGFESAHDEEVTLAALEMTQLTRYRDVRVCELSGGEKQRLLLARALVQESLILLLDELTANLDINYQVELMRLVRRLTRERRLATLVVSHEIHLLGSFSDRIALMSEGTIRCQGTVSEVITRENLSRIFGLDFQVRRAADGLPEVLPVIEERR